MAVRSGAAPRRDRAAVGHAPSGHAPRVGPPVAARARHTPLLASPSWCIPQPRPTPRQPRRGARGAAVAAAARVGMKALGRSGAAARRPRTVRAGRKPRWSPGIGRHPCSS
eukprot:6682-Chlamydomonas_euryale.AAC.5